MKKFKPFTFEYFIAQTCREKLSVLSAADNQIVTLSARSPYNALSGCSIVPKTRPTLIPPPVFPASYTTASPPPEVTVPSNNDDPSRSTETTYDKFLKRTTTDAPTEFKNRDGKSLDNATDDFASSEFDSDSFDNFNETEVFNASATGGDQHSRNGGGLYFKHDVVFENQLENSTEYKTDVEELFESPKAQLLQEEPDENSRSRRADSYPFARKSRETYIVRCHNAGTFISSRERWWYIAISSCGSDKGLDVEYRFKMTNGQPGDFWHEHFSADERRK